jgi:hypothetical protein
MGGELNATGIWRPGQIDPHRVVQPRVEQNSSQPVIARSPLCQVE